MSVVLVSLPQAKPAMLMHPGQAGAGEMTGKRKLRVMIVEDEFIIALELEMLLAEMGIEIAASANTAEKAIALAEEVRPDFVTMDIRLPGRDGISAATEIFERFGIRSIFVSAYKDAELMERARSAQPLGWVRKPVSPAELRAALPTPQNGVH